MENKKVVIVTGGSRGIGREICLEHARNNCNIVVNYSGNQEKALETAAACKEFGVEAIIIKADVSKAAEVDAMINEVLNTFKRIDILVNNAGVVRDNLLMRMKEEEFDSVIDINLKGVFLCSKAVLRTMVKQRCGRIINITSIVGIFGNPGQANYAASKAGIIGITKSLAKEIGSRGITVNAVAPGFIETDMTESLTEELQENVIKQITLRRLGTTSDIAKAVSFLSSDSASYITGQVLSVDGGMII